MIPNPPNPPNTSNPPSPPTPPAPPKLPFDPVKVGKSLINVGNEQKKAALRLANASEKLRRFADAFNSHNQISQTLTDIRQSVSSIRLVLSSVRSALEFVHTKLDDITVPKVEYSTTKIMNITVINGIEVVKKKPFSDIAEKFGDAAAKIDDIREYLRKIDHGLQLLKENLPLMKMSMYTTCDDLQASSTGLDTAGDNLINAGTALGA